MDIIDAAGAINPATAGLDIQTRAICEVFREELWHFWEVPRAVRAGVAVGASIADVAAKDDALQAFSDFIDHRYAEDVIVVHAHGVLGDQGLHHQTTRYREKIDPASKHTHKLDRLNGKNKYLESVFSSQIASFLELRHTIQWVNIRERPAIGAGHKTAVAVVGVTMEGVEALLLPASDPNSIKHPDRDRGYQNSHIHRGVWVMRNAYIDDQTPGSNHWVTHFVLSGFPADSTYTPKINHAAVKAGTLPVQKKTFDFDVEPLVTVLNALNTHKASPTGNPNDELLGWEIIIDGLR